MKKDKVLQKAESIWSLSSWQITSVSNWDLTKEEMKLFEAV